MTQPKRHGSTDFYRYGFQDQEKDDEVKGEGNSLNYKYRMHDPRIGRFFAVDPLDHKYAYNSPYAFSENRLLDGVELEGLEYSKLSGSLFRGSLLSGFSVRTAVVDATEIAIDGVTFTVTSITLGIWVGGSYGYREFRYGDGDIGKPEWHNYIQYGFSWEGGFEQDGYNSGKGNVSTEDGVRIFEGITALVSIGEITQTIKLIKIGTIKNSTKLVFSGLSESKTTSLVGNANDIDVLEKLSVITKNSENIGGLSRLSNDNAWNNIMEKHKYLKETDIDGYWKKVNDEWWDDYNKPWLDDIIERGDDIKITSDKNVEGNLYFTNPETGVRSKRHFKREIDYLESKGYKEKDGYFVKDKD